MCGILDSSLEPKMGGNGKADAIQTEPTVQITALGQRPLPSSDNSAVIIPEATSKAAGGRVLKRRPHFFVPSV